VTAPMTIYELAAKVVDEQVAQRPLLATLVGIPGYDHLWNDFSIEGRRAEADLYRDQLRRVGQVDTGDDRWAALGVRVAAEAMANELSWHDSEEPLRQLNSIDCPLQSMREIFDHMSKDGAEAWSNIAARLATLGNALRAYRSTLEEGRRRGMAVAQRQVIETARQARNFAGEASPFLDLASSAELAAVGDGALMERVEDGVAAARAAYARFADYLEREYLPSAVEKDAVGPDRFVMLARHYLGDDIDPRAAYQWGWEEVARLRARMEEVAEQILPGGTLPEVLHLLLTDPERAAHGQDQFRDLMQARLQQALDELSGVHFDVPEPIRRVDVKMAPPGGSLGAYYVSPSEDFTRPGCVWWSKGDKRVLPLFDEVSTAYHEGFPGHHLQTGIQMAAGDRITRFQKLLVWYSGSGEGWALYAEDLMEELGYLEKPDYVMGKLASEMLRATRVVIDIGSHLELPIPRDQPFHPGEAWTFETGVEMLDDYAAQDHDISVSEMNRYLGWPGQAISYKIGQQAIRDLRADAQRSLGSAFDPKAFHARLLEIGSTGLRVMREHMSQQPTADG
jgi:uncharacterized protein (DUF885 family)